MRSIACLISMIMAVLMGACSHVAAKEIREEHFVIQVPEGFTIRKSSPVEDFDVYVVEKANRPYIGIYVGNHPTLPKKKPPADAKVTEFSANEVRIVSAWHQGHLVGKDVLVAVNPGGKPSWPMFIHGWISELPPAEVEVGDRILMSMQVVRKNGK